MTTRTARAIAGRISTVVAIVIVIGAAVLIQGKGAAREADHLRVNDYNSCIRQNGSRMQGNERLPIAQASLATLNPRQVHVFVWFERKLHPELSTWSDVRVWNWAQGRLQPVPIVDCDKAVRRP